MKKSLFLIACFILGIGVNMPIKINATSKNCVYHNESNSEVIGQYSDKFVRNITAYFYNGSLYKSSTKYSLYERYDRGRTSYFIVDPYGNSAWVQLTSNNRQFKYTFYINGWFYFN